MAFGRGIQLNFILMAIAVITLLLILAPTVAQAADPGTIPECSAQRIDPRNLESCINPSNSTFPWIVETWRWSLSFVNLFAVVVLIAMAFSNILYALPILEPYRIRQLLPSFIGGIVLANLSLLFCRIIVSSADLLMSGGGFEVTTQELWSGWGFDVGRLKDGVIPALYGDNVDPNPGALLFQLLISTLLTYAPIIALTILAFVFFIRSGIIFLLTAISPLAFGSIIFPATRQYLQRWWDTYWKWLYGGVGSYLILMLAANISSKTTANLISTSGAVSAINLSLTYLLSLALVYFAIITPFKLGGELGARWSSFGKGLWNKAKWLGGKGIEATKYGAERAGYWSKYGSAKALTESTKNLSKLDTDIGAARSQLGRARQRERDALAAGAPNAAAEAATEARNLEGMIRQAERSRRFQARKVRVAQGVHGTLHAGDFRKEAKEARGKMRERTMGLAGNQSTLRERTLGKYLGDDAMRTLLAAQKEKAANLQLPEEALAAVRAGSPWFQDFYDRELADNPALSARDRAERHRLRTGLFTGDIAVLNKLAQDSHRSRGDIAGVAANLQAYKRLSYYSAGQAFDSAASDQYIQAALGRGAPPVRGRGRGRGPRPGGGGRGGRGGGPYAGDAEEIILPGTGYGGGPAVVQGAPAQVSQTIQQIDQQKRAAGGRTAYQPGGGNTGGAPIGMAAGAGGPASGGAGSAAAPFSVRLDRRTLQRLKENGGLGGADAGGPEPSTPAAAGATRAGTVNITTAQANVAAGQTRVGAASLSTAGLGLGGGGTRGPLSVTMSGKPSTIGQAGGGAAAPESMTLSPAGGLKSSAPSTPPAPAPAPAPRVPYNPAQVQGRTQIATSLPPIPPPPPAPPAPSAPPKWAPPYVPNRPPQPPASVVEAPQIAVAPSSPATIVGRRTQAATTFSPRSSQRLATPTATRIPGGPTPRPVAPAAPAPNSDALKAELQRIDESRERERRKIWTSDRSVEERMRLERENTRVHDSQAIAAENRFKKEQSSDLSLDAQALSADLEAFRDNAAIMAAGQAQLGPQLAKSLDLNLNEDEDEDEKRSS